MVCFLGFAGTLLAITAILSWFYRSVIFAQLQDGEKGTELRWALLFAIFSACIQAMVDGVLVMPYPQTWLAILVGWASAKYLATQNIRTIQIPRPALIFCLFLAGAWLSALALRDYPDLVIHAHLNDAFYPRFWCSGSIGDAR